MQGPLSCPGRGWLCALRNHSHTPPDRCGSHRSSSVRRCRITRRLPASHQEQCPEADSRPENNAAQGCHLNPRQRCHPPRILVWIWLSGSQSNEIAAVVDVTDIILPVINQRCPYGPARELRRIPPDGMRLNQPTPNMSVKQQVPPTKEALALLDKKAPEPNRPQCYQHAENTSSLHRKTARRLALIEPPASMIPYKVVTRFPTLTSCFQNGTGS